MTELCEPFTSALPCCGRCRKILTWVSLWQDQRGFGSTCSFRRALGGDSRQWEGGSSLSSIHSDSFHISTGPWCSVTIIEVVGIAKWSCNEALSIGGPLTWDTKPILQDTETGPASLIPSPYLGMHSPEDRRVCQCLVDSSPASNPKLAHDLGF